MDGLHETVDCSLIKKESSVTIMLANHTTPGHSIEAEHIEIRLDNAREPVAAYVKRIDDEHANAKRLWVEMGQPEYLGRKEVEQLEEASQLKSETQRFSYRDGILSLKINLPAHAVAAITIEFKPETRANA